jgi:ribose transport system substrate-binding protein
MTTTFERRQQILKLLQEQSSAKVSELAELLEVSEATIRKDLTALDESQKLTRVRGGAALPEVSHTQNPVLAARAKVNAIAKQHIARCAATMVEDGDSILLDASTSVLHMVPFLQEHRNLTIFTNGIEIGCILARNPANTVILIGGMIRPQGTSVEGYFGEEILKELRIKTAFVSCTGFMTETGLTELDIQEIPLKRHMINCANQVVALIDSTKFGQTALTAFATVDQISRIVTDSDIDPAYIEELRHAQINVTICGETTTSSITPLDIAQTHHKVGFANLSENVPFAIDVQQSVERAAKEAGNIDLIVANNQLDGQIALHVADRLIARGVDIVIEYQIDERMGGLIMNRFQQANIPVIAVDIPMVGATFFGVDNYCVGQTAGEALGEWINKHWQGNIDRLIVLEEPRAGALPATRIQGQLQGLQSIIGEIEAEKIIVLDSESTSEKSEMQMTNTLRACPHIHKIAVIPFNSDATLGALAAAHKTNRKNDVVLVGQGGDRRLRQKIRETDSRLIGSTAFRHESYGQQLIEIALKILRGVAVPPATYTEHIFLTRENVDRYYPDD